MNGSLKDLFSIIEQKMDAQLQKKGIIENDDSNKAAQSEKDLRTLATQGSREARLFIKSRIVFILTSLKDFVNSENVDRLLKEYNINYYENIYTGKKEINEATAAIDAEIAKYFCRYSVKEDDSFDLKLEKLAQICYQEMYGYSILDELIFDSELNEVACNRYDYIWIQYKGVKRKIPNRNFVFSSREKYETIIENRLTSTARVEMNNGQPVIYSVLESGSRVTALRPPLSRYFTVSIRLFNNAGGEAGSEFNWTIKTKLQNIPEIKKQDRRSKLFQLLEILIKKGRRNIAIIGEQGSGKTTAADKIVISSLDDDLSIGLAENVHELDISRKYRDKNIIELQYGSNFSPSDVMEIFFRLNRDIVIFGEVRNHYEAFEMLKAMLRQARGSLFTFHSSSVKRMVHDLRQLLIQTGFYRDYKEAQFDVADAVDIIIHVKLDRKTGERDIYRVCELVAIEETMSYRINDLFIYDKEQEVYLVNSNGLDKSTIEDCLCYEFTAKDIAGLKRIFSIMPEESNSYKYIDFSNEGDLLNVYGN